MGTRLPSTLVGGITHKLCRTIQISSASAKLSISTSQGCTTLQDRPNKIMTKKQRRPKLTSGRHHHQGKRKRNLQCTHLKVAWKLLTLKNRHPLTKIPCRMSSLLGQTRGSNRLLRNTTTCLYRPGRKPQKRRDHPKRYLCITGKIRYLKPPKPRNKLCHSRLKRAMRWRWSMKGTKMRVDYRVTNHSSKISLFNPGNTAQQVSLWSEPKEP